MSSTPGIESDRFGNWGALPPVEELTRLYVEKGMSLDEIAERFNVRRNSVYNKMHRHALKTGGSWPLKQGRPGWVERRGEIHSRRRWKSVKGMLVAGEIADSCETYRCSLAEFAERVGTSRTSVYQIVNGRQARVSQELVDRVMVVVEELEAGVWTPDEKRWRMRRLVA